MNKVKIKDMINIKDDNSNLNKFFYEFLKNNDKSFYYFHI